MAEGEMQFRQIFNQIRNGSATTGLQVKVGYKIIRKRVAGVYCFETVMDDRNLPISSYMDEINEILPARGKGAEKFMESLYTLLRQLDEGQKESIRIPFLQVDAHVGEVDPGQRDKNLEKIKKLLEFKLQTPFEHGWFNFPGSNPFASRGTTVVAASGVNAKYFVNQSGDDNFLIILPNPMEKKLRLRLVKELGLTTNVESVNRIVENEKIYHITIQKLSEWGIEPMVSINESFFSKGSLLMFDTSGTLFGLSTGYNLTRV